MAWTIPTYKRGQVDRAGKILIDPEATPSQVQLAWVVAENWRSSHAYPLNHFQNLLRRKTRRVDPLGIVVQRQKRRHSIELKLRDNPAMQLSQMQDLGGCRAIVSDVGHVEELVKSFETSRTRAELTKKYDYIEKPRPSGYRGVHLVYRYRSDYEASKVFNALRIEIQLRSALQHAWATAVEVAGAFRGEALKSSHGHQDWLRFFQLMGTEIAMTEECPPVEATPHDSYMLREELRECVMSLGVDQLLTGWTASVDAIQQGTFEKAHYYVLALDTVGRRLTMTGFAQNRLADAEAARSRQEAENAGKIGFDVVLVSADKVEELTKAYPNYSLDTSAFVSEMRAAVGGD